MAPGQFNSKSPTIRRILREAAELSNTPSPDYTATPLDDNLFEWHFTLRGPPGDSTSPASAGSPSPTSLSSNTKLNLSKASATGTGLGGVYSEGMYHGRIVLPPTYPLRPPSFRFMTPSGRFETNREICLSISGHHEETWQPAWGLRTALVALRTFMETSAHGQLGGLECTDSMRRQLAKSSSSWKCPSCNKTNLEILTACTEAASKVTGADRKEEEVPKELKMEWKDEMNKGTEATGEGQLFGSGERENEEDAESAELAEGFVQTVPTTPRIPETGDMQQTQYPAARPLQGVPQPTATIPSATMPVPQAQAVQARQRSNDGIPEWVDKAIIGIAVALVIMIIRMLIRFDD